MEWFNINHLKGRDFDVTARLDRDPAFRAITISCDVAVPGLQGSGIDGRVPHRTTFRDLDGILDFATALRDAPIMHFGGPLQITLYDKSHLRLGRSDNLYLVIGTPGVGPGTFVAMDYDRVVPPVATPRVVFEFPTGDGVTLAVTTNSGNVARAVNLYGQCLSRRKSCRARPT